MSWVYWTTGVQRALARRRESIGGRIRRQWCFGGKSSGRAVKKSLGRNWFVYLQEGDVLMQPKATMEGLVKFRFALQALFPSPPCSIDSLMMLKE
jgi:hypothetical protein